MEIGFVFFLDISKFRGSYEPQTTYTLGQNWTNTNKFNPLSFDAFSDEINVTENINFVFHRVENSLEK